MEALGIVAIAFGAAAYIWKDPRNIMRLSALASTTWVLYFISHQQWAPMFVTMTFVVVLIAGAQASTRKMRAFVLGREALIVPFIILTSSGIPMVLLLCGGLTKGFSPLLRDRPYLFRLSVASGEGLWLAYGILENIPSTVAWSVIAISVSLGSGIIHAMRELPAAPARSAAV